MQEYFELLNFEAEDGKEKLVDTVDPSPLIGPGKTPRMDLRTTKSIPKLINFSTKAIGAKQAYKEFLKQKAKDFSRIETEYYHIKEMLSKCKESRVDVALKEAQDKGNF